MIELFIFIGWLVLSGLNCFIAGEKNRSPGAWLIFSLIFSPVLIVLFLIAIPEKKLLNQEESSLAATEKDIEAT